MQQYSAASRLTDWDHAVMASLNSSNSPTDIRWAARFPTNTPKSFVFKRKYENQQNEYANPS